MTSTSWVQQLAVAIAAIIPGYWVLSRVAERWSYRHFTALNDIKQIGTPRRDGSKMAGTVVICGGRCVSQTYGADDVYSLLLLLAWLV
jgi:hypothetical protein